MTSAVATENPAAKKYVPRGRNELHRIFERHFVDFCNIYEERYAQTYGLFRLERIQRLGERFTICGDYLQGVARVRCTNPECGQDCFRPFSCKGFYLCPSCSRKRTLLFAEHLTEEVLLNLPHRQFVFIQDACASSNSTGIATSGSQGASTVLPTRPYFFRKCLSAD